MSSKRIVIVEPSPFRRTETYVLGPFGSLRSWFEAHLATMRHPYSKVLVTTSRSRVSVGDRVLWPRQEKEIP